MAALWKPTGVLLPVVRPRHRRQLMDLRRTARHDRECDGRERAAANLWETRTVRTRTPRRNPRHHDTLVRWRRTRSSTSLVADIRPISRTSPSTCRKRQIQQPKRHVGIILNQRSPLFRTPGPTSGTPQGRVTRVRDRLQGPLSAVLSGCSLGDRPENACSAACRGRAVLAGGGRSRPGERDPDREAALHDRFRGLGVRVQLLDLQRSSWSRSVARRGLTSHWPARRRVNFPFCPLCTTAETMAERDSLRLCANEPFQPGPADRREARSRAPAASLVRRHRRSGHREGPACPAVHGGCDLRQRQVGKGSVSRCTVQGSQRVRGRQASHGTEGIAYR
jgi:hypothetical protein